MSAENRFDFGPIVSSSSCGPGIHASQILVASPLKLLLNCGYPRPSYINSPSIYIDEFLCGIHCLKLCLARRAELIFTTVKQVVLRLAPGLLKNITNLNLETSLFVIRL